MVYPRGHANRKEPTVKGKCSMVETRASKRTDPQRASGPAAPVSSRADGRVAGGAGPLCPARGAGARHQGHCAGSGPGPALGQHVARPLRPRPAERARRRGPVGAPTPIFPPKNAMTSWPWRAARGQSTGASGPVGPFARWPGRPSSGGSSARLASVATQAYVEKVDGIRNPFIRHQG